MAGTTDRTVLVCGGAVMDCIARPHDPAQRGASKTSMPGRALLKLGGVGRNIAEVLSRLGCRVGLMSIVGEDEQGRAIRASCQALGINSDALFSSRSCRTATFTALLDGSGELVGGIADMEAFDALTPELVDTLPAEAPPTLLLCDGNLPAATLERLLLRSAAAAAPAWFEPVSVVKAARGRCARRWQLVSPNWDELLSLVGWPAAPTPHAAEGLHADVVAALRAALESVAECVLLTLGPRGAVLARREGAAPQGGSRSRTHSLRLSELLRGVPGIEALELAPLELRVEEHRVDGLSLIWYRPRPLESVRDVTGAGDNLVAGTAHGFARGWALEDAVLLGLVCAHLVLHVDGGVPDFFNADVFERVAAALGTKSRL